MGDGVKGPRKVLARLGLVSAGTTEGRAHNFTRWRTLTQLFWLVVISSVLLGIPYFAQDPRLRNLFWPTLSSRFLTYNPTSCIYYAVTSGLASGYAGYYIVIIVPLALFIFLVLLMGRSWCAWTCPIGFAQELIAGLRRLLGFPYSELHPKLVMALDRFKYAFLFFVVLIALSSGIPYLGLEFLATDFADPSCQLCPSRPLCSLTQMAIGVDPLQAEIPQISYVILAIFLVGAFRIRRFWCRICPLGAMMAPMNRRAMLSLTKDGNKCTRCRACLRVCPVDVEEVYVEMERTNISAPECIHCYRCVEECPEKDCLKVEYLGVTLAGSGLKTPKKRKGRGKEPPAPVSTPPSLTPSPITPVPQEKPPPAAPSAAAAEPHPAAPSAAAAMPPPAAPSAAAAVPPPAAPSAAAAVPPPAAPSAAAAVPPPAAPSAAAAVSPPAAPSAAAAEPPPAAPPAAAAEPPPAAPPAAAAISPSSPSPPDSGDSGG